MDMQREDTTVDHQEFDAMYRKNYKEIYKFICYKVEDPELAQDVMQETFYIAYKKWNIVRGLSNPVGWLIQTAKNKICELNRKLKKLECEVTLEPEEYMVNEDGYGKIELDTILLKDLSNEEKRRFVRYFVCGYTISEMAKMERISENNMSVRISRLRDKIAKNLPEGAVFDKKQRKSVRIDKKTSCT